VFDSKQAEAGKIRFPGIRFHPRQSPTGQQESAERGKES